MPLPRFVLALFALAASAQAAPSSPPAQAALAQSALTDIIVNRASPIFGFDNGCDKTVPTCDWMSRVPDSTLLVHMNLPGTHDTSTWNYSDATQASLERYTGYIGPSNAYRCQEHSIVQSLNEGIRVFDLRYAYNPGNDTIGFHHSAALLAPTTRIEDVFFGLYNWLDSHPTEAVLVSMNHEGSTGTPNDPALQEHIYNLLTSQLANKYWVQANGTLGTLGQARGKLTLLQRFDYALLPTTPAYSKRIGIALGADQWTDNGKSIEIIYNDNGGKAFIEDYYASLLALGSGATAYIASKYNATTAHLLDAINPSLNPDQLYISFASAAFIEDSPPMTPQIFALGNGTSTPGMNQLLLPWLKARKGKRFGVIMLDFYDAVPGLVEAVIGL